MPIFHYEIEQRTPEWYAIRWGLITGTRSKGLLGKSSTLLRDILSEKLEEYDPTSDDPFTNHHMQRGLDMEPHARHYLSQYIGIELKECGFIQSEKHPLLGISPDGVSECETVQCEIKCLSKEQHTELLRPSGTIDTDHLCQIVHAFAVNSKLKSMWFIAYRPESMKNAFIREFTLDTVVDLGTKSKPNTKTIREWVAFELETLEQFEKDLKTEYDAITGI